LSVLSQVKTMKIFSIYKESLWNVMGDIHNKHEV